MRIIYPTLDEIEIRWRSSGSGVCVIVEGETEHDDPWFFQKWFSSYAREITFFPRDGWELVIHSVTDLRQRPSLGIKKVYGIIDRDFETPVYAPFPTNGILRLHKYTLENYLLDPEIWFKVVSPFISRNPKPGWCSKAEIQATIEALYRECIPLAAYNWVLYTIQSSTPSAFNNLSASERVYATHPQVLQTWGDISTRLRALQTHMDLIQDLVQLYTERLAILGTKSLAELETLVTGKTVLKLFREAFPLRLTGSRAWDDVLGAYMYHCAKPPLDLTRLVDLILEDACT